jgi:membrane associated rhomboid family serine protease
LQDVIVDICPKCAGIWFDSGELQVVLRGLIESDKITPEPTRLYQRKAIQTLDESAAEIRCCPKCDMVMKTFNYSYDSNVFVDKCPECQGIWTDAGEVKRLARYLKTDPRVQVIGQHVAERHDFLEALRGLGDVGHNLKRNGYVAACMPRIILPLGDDLECERFPVVTYSIILSCIAVFLYQLFKVDDLSDFFHRYGHIPADFFSLRLVTSMFLHADIFHVGGNLFFLWIFGDNVEDRFGRLGYMLLYFAAGITSAAAFTVFNLDCNIPLIGASGAISGVMGAYLVLHPNAKLKMLIYCYIIPVPASIYLTVWFLLQVAYSSTSAFLDDQGIAWLAHAGGFAFGALVGWLKKHKDSVNKGTYQTSFD